MNLSRLLLFAIALFLTASSVSLPTVVTAQQGKSAHSKKTTQFQYVCPMHDTVTSKSPGVCRKCKMKLVKKPIVKESSSSAP